MRLVLTWQRILALVLVLSVLIPAAPAFAQPEGKLRACVARLLPATSISSIPAESFDCTDDHRKWGPGNFAVRIELPSVQSEAGDPLVFRHTSVWQRSERIAIHYADGHIVRHEFTSADASRFLTIGAIFEFPIPVRAAPLTHIEAEVMGAANLRGILIGPQLMRQSEAYGLRARVVALYATFAGLAMALLVYNLSLWAAMRARFQIHYCGMVAGLSAYTFTSSGALLLVLPMIDNNDRLRLNYLLLAISAVLALRFIRHFFGDSVFGPRLRQATAAVSAAALVSACGFALLSPQYIGFWDRAYFMATGGILSLMVPTIYRAWAVRNRYLWLFLFAWSAPILTSVLRNLYGFGLVSYSFWLDNGNLIALSIEALLSAIMVTVRLRDLSFERDDAKARAIVAQRLANTDPLTGLLNRRAFLDMAIDKPGRQRLLLLDIDHFKRINDRCGHDAGDDVLRAVAAVMQQCRPPNSLVVRLGGEEFGLLAPCEGSAVDLPERLLAALRSVRSSDGKQVTASLGVAEGVVPDETGWKHLYRQADLALYRAKNDGRNRVCRSSELPIAA